MTPAVTVVEAAQENLRQPHQLLIPTARILLAGPMATEVTVMITVLFFRQDVPKLVLSIMMTVYLFLKDS